MLVAPPGIASGDIKFSVPTCSQADTPCTHSDVATFICSFMPARIYLQTTLPLASCHLHDRQMYW